MKTAIIGIGASAGGLEAISDLLSSLPARPGAAIVVVQHLERSHDSLLSGILRRRSPIPVVQAADGMPARPDNVYVIPPNVTLTLSQGNLVLTPRAAGREVHKPVDALFRSMAEEYGESAVAVVLSGADSDGSEGIRAIKESGGFTFAQAPETAGVPSMPLSAIETGFVDRVLPPNEIARELVRLASHPYLQPGPLDEAEEPAADESELLHRIFRRLRSTQGVDFTRYKPSTLRRRLARRMAVQRIAGLGEYAELLENDPVETAALYQDFLIRVTSFFRDPETFRVLLEQVFPRLAAAHSPKEPIRIWVPGCATGEEVFSIGIALIESLGQATPHGGIQIFGTDVSDTAIDKCRAGVYPESIADDVSHERLKRFFVKQGSQYVIARSIRDLCVFARHDITRDPPYSRLDFISCRNLLIYLSPAAQNRVMHVFRYALRPQGYLLLGVSESVGHGEEFFESIDKQHRLYRPKATMNVSTLGLMTDREHSAEFARASAIRPVHEIIESDAVQKQADRLLLARYAPAGILVDEQLNIQQFRGETAPYLAPASGPPSLNLMRIVRPELLLAVPPLMQEARKTGRPATRAGLALEGVGNVDVEVVPLLPMSGEQCFLILLENQQSPHAARRDRLPPPTPLSDSEKDQRIAQVERENFELREFLQATLEHHEAAKEELRSAHEEVLSANEEFQSTNEELETSKEELQSANEELTTTNEELRERNRLLGVVNAELEQARTASERARAYADGIVDTVREPLVVLDGELKVLRVNTAFCAEFGVSSDRVEGHSLDVVSTALWDETLNEKLTAILSKGPVVSDFEIIFEDPRLGTRLLCLNARRIAGDSERTELILLGIEDVTESRRRNDALREGSRRKDEFLAMLAHELRNPLGAISHAIHLLQTKKDENVALMHALIDRQTSRLVRLVNDLLDVARVSRGLIELQREPVDLALTLRHAAEAARGRLEQQRHVLTVSVPDFPVIVEGDAVRLEQVVANLLENAIKYTPPGGRLSIELVEDAQEAVLTVSDNGVGIAPENVRQVFEMFTQLDSSRTRGGGGLGLGLTVVRRVIELHGGRIEVRSAGLGRGSQFIARLPRLSPSSLPEPARVPVVAPSVRRPRRVLLVDDNPDSSAVIALVLEQAGHEVRTVASGREALQLLDSYMPDVAFIDINLPDMDGYQLVERLREMPGSGAVRMIALTGYGTAADRERARDAGFHEHVVKPADAEKLEELINGDE